jgi:hypothetical protein
MNIKIGQRVYIKCHAFKGGRKYYGCVKEVINDRQLLVLIDGNTKKTKIASIWVTPSN